jgi:hypothetical protein
MPFPPPVLPINRTNATAQQDTHPADHNAAALAINDTVARVVTLGNTVDQLTAGQLRSARAVVRIPNEHPSGSEYRIPHGLTLAQIVDGMVSAQVWEFQYVDGVGHWYPGTLAAVTGVQIIVRPIPGQDLLWTIIYRNV